MDIHLEPNMHMDFEPNLKMDLLDPDLNRNWYPWSPTPAASYLATPIMPNFSHAMSRSRTTDTITIAHSTTVPDPPCPIAIVAIHRQAPHPISPRESPRRRDSSNPNH